MKYLPFFFFSFFSQCLYWNEALLSDATVTGCVTLMIQSVPRITDFYTNRSTFLYKIVSITRSESPKMGNTSLPFAANTVKEEHYSH